MVKQCTFFFSIAVAISLSCLQQGKQGFENAKFNFGINRMQEQKNIEATVRLYNATTSGLYATGAYPEEFKIMPADNLLKRKHFQNVSQLINNGKLLVFDLDNSNVKKVQFYGRNRACVITSEVWAMAFQDLSTRKRVSKVKGEALTVRYLLGRQDAKWLVMEVEVFPATASVSMPDKSLI